MKLQSMTDFVLGTMQNQKFRRDRYDDICSYAHFLKQPLELWMFVPCDLDGNVLKKPNELNKKILLSTINRDINMLNNFYKQAKERVLFEGFRIENYVLTNDVIGIGCTLTLYSTIECLVVDFEGDIALTESAIKQFM